MAQAIPVNAVVELTLQSYYQNQLILNVFHYVNATDNIPSGSGDGELAFLGETFFETLITDPATGLQLNVVESFNWQYARMQVVAPTRGYYITYTNSITGALAVPGIPSNTHLTVAYRTDAAGRGKTGNKKFTGFAASTITQNFFNEPIVTFMAEWAANSEAQLDDSTGAPRWQPIIWSPRRATDRRRIVGTLADNSIHVLRRRSLRVGI